MRKGVSLLLVDVALAGHGGVTRFSVGHSEKVVSSDSTGVTVVAGNRVINLLSFNFGIGSEELSHGGLLGLAGGFTVGGVHLAGVESLGVGLELFLLDNAITVFHIASPELADISRVNRLGVAVFVTLDSNNLSSSLVLALGVVKHGLTSSGAELVLDGEVDSAVEVVGSGRERGLSVSFSIEVLTLDSGNIAAVAWDSVLGFFVSSNLIRSLFGSLMASVAGNLALFRFKQIGRAHV